MSTLLVIILASIIVGFIYRANRLFNLLKKAAYYVSLEYDKMPSQIQCRQASAGCLGCLCFPFFCLFIITPIYLFFKVDWWIPVVAFIVGLTITNLIGCIIEKVLQLPTHQKKRYSNLDVNAIELASDNRLFQKTLRLLIFYNVISLLIMFIIMFNL